MPVSSRSQRAEAKYNVTTEFPHLGLHSAASTGNIGLVKYALSHGQPINSVIDGVLPLHCACSGGNALVVKLLIDSGADVNAPRLPRRYSPSAPRSPNTTPAPIVGTSGSTPLHFAAANGHTAVVRLLLQHGARPGRPDKHGITPEMVARQNGWVGCAEAIGEWVREKDRDLRERETVLGNGIYGENGEEMEQEELPKKECTCWWSRARDRGASLCSHCEAETQIGLSTSLASSSSVRKRLHMKRSIDNVLQHIKSSSSSLSTPTSHMHSLSMSSASQPSSTPPTSTSTTRVASPDDSFSRLSSSPSPNMLSSRRPSLPTDDPSAPALATARHKQRRPSSAGTGSASPSSTASSIQAGQQARKLGSKYSLLHLFRRGSVDTDRDEAEEGKTGGGILRGQQRHQRSTSGSSTPPPTASSMKLRFSRSRSRSRTRATPPADDAAVAEPDSDDEEEYGEPLPTSARAFGLRPRGQSMNSQLSRYSISADELGARAGAGTGEEQSLGVPAPDMPGRTRGDSASSVSASSPSPATPPALPYTTAVHASPGPMELALPVVREREREKARPGDIDIGAISSHAQAEALVQRTQAEVLALAGAGAEAGGLLSARLAAYGESLAIERRLREQDGGARTSGSSEFEGPFGGAARSASMEGSRDGAGVSMRGGHTLERAGSVGTPGAVSTGGRSRHAGRAKVRRPHTSGSMAVSEEFMPSPGSSSDHHHHHHRSRSAAPPSIAIHPDPDSNTPSALETALHSYEPNGYDDPDADEHLDTFPVPGPLQISTSLESGFPSRPPSRTPTHALTLPLDADHPRARTPDPETPDLHVGTGHALCRVLTAPDLLTPSSPTGSGRHIARKNKLAKMGFTGVEAGGGTPPGGGGRFGGFRNLMASLKGKP